MSPTDIRIQVTFATVKLQPSPMIEADYRAEAAKFQELVRANERCELGKLFMHKAEAIEEQRDGKSYSGQFQSAVFDIDKSDGKQELSELVVAVAQTIVDHVYPEEKKLIG